MAKKKSGKKGAAILTVDLGDRGGKHSFRSLREASDWLQKEQEAWSWIPELTGHQGRLAGLAMSLWKKMSPQYSRIDSKIEDVSIPSGEKPDLAAIEEVIHRAFLHRGLIHSSSRMAKVVFAEREIGDGAGLGALSYYMHAPQDVTDSLVFRGRLSAVLAEFGLHGTTEAARKSLDDLHAEILSQFVDYKTEQDGLLTTSRGFNKEIENQIGSHSQEHTELIVKHYRDFSDLITKSKEEWQNLRQTYDAALALQAPVRYWSAKRKMHHQKSKTWGWLFGIGLGVATLILIPALIGIFWGETLKPGRIGVAVVLVTFALWGLSILARNLLSHQHLATDADERVVMVLTYLALRREGKGLGDEQMKFILQPLFRSASTGIVKDDARPPSVVERIMGKQGL